MHLGSSHGPLAILKTKEQSWASLWPLPSTSSSLFHVYIHLHYGASYCSWTFLPVCSLPWELLNPLTPWSGLILQHWVIQEFNDDIKDYDCPPFCLPSTLTMVGSSCGPRITTFDLLLKLHLFSSSRERSRESNVPSHGTIAFASVWCHYLGPALDCCY